MGVDLAKAADYTAMSVIELDFDYEIYDCKYHLIALDRSRGIEYPVIVDLMEKTIVRLEKEMHLYDTYPFGGPILCMDASGLGAPIRDYLKANHVIDQAGRKLFPVVFTGGESKRFDLETGNYNISKSLIVSNLLSLMQRHRFDYAPDLQALPLLEQEIANFKYHLTAGGHATFDAAEGAHDDLINSIAIPLIIAEWRFAPRLRR